MRMAANPMDLVCYASYDSPTDTWSGPPGTGLLLAWDLERRLNFTTQLIYANMSWGSPVGENEFDGIVRLLQRGDADWSPCSVTRTLDRYAAVDFSPTPYQITELVMSLRVPSHSENQYESTSGRFDSLFRPFTASVWFYLTGLLLLCCVISTRAGGNFFSSCINLVSPLLGKPMSIIMSSGGWIMFLTWLIPCLLLSIQYASQITSHLASQSRTLHLITSRQQALDYIQHGRVTPLTYAGSWVSDQVDIWFGNKWRHTKSRVKSLEDNKELVHRVLNNPRNGWIDTNFDAKRIYMRHGVHIFDPSRDSEPSLRKPNVYLVGKGENRGPSFDGFAFSRHAPHFTRQALPWLMRYTELGHVTHWDSVSERSLKQHFANATKDQEDPRQEVLLTGLDDAKVMTLRDFASCYLVYAILVALSLICVFIEKIRYTLQSVSVSCH